MIEDKVNCIGPDTYAKLGALVNYYDKSIHVEAVVNGYVVTCGGVKSIARTPTQVATLVRRALTTSGTVKTT